MDQLHHQVTMVTIMKHSLETISFGIIIIKLSTWYISRRRNQLLKKVACSPSKNKYVLETMVQGISPNKSAKKQMTPTFRQFKVGDLVIVCADDTPAILVTGHWVE